MQELVTKNQDDLLTPCEQSELENDRRISFLIELM